MTAVNRMTNVPWHIEKYTREEDDDRRHRNRCVYYRKEDKYCSKLVSKCCGSAHCSYYKELDLENNNEYKNKVMTEKKRTIDTYDAKRLFPIGSCVRHKTLGPGIVKEISDGKIFIDFRDMGEKIFKLDICVKNNLIMRDL